MTVCFELLFFSLPIYSPSLLLYYRHSPSASCSGLELDLPSDTKTGTRCLADCTPTPPIYYMPLPHPYCTSYVCISTCWCTPFVHPPHPHLLAATLCIIAPLVHVDHPSYMCTTTPLMPASVGNNTGTPAGIKHWPVPGLWWVCSCKPAGFCDAGRRVPSGLG